MSLDLVDYDVQARKAIKAFWGSRDAAIRKQRASGTTDAGTRGAVTAGKNMDGFRSLVAELVRANGLPDAEIHTDKALVVLPGFFRPTKLWDMLVMHRGQLVAALEFKSQVGSFGNNFNNRTEEAIGTAHCLWTAHREGAFGSPTRPFLGWVMVVEDAPGSRQPVRAQAPHFPVAPEFQDASYLRRYDIFCQKLMREGLYTAAALLATPKTAKRTGAYAEMSKESGLENFATTLAGHVAMAAARSRD